MEKKGSWNIASAFDPDRASDLIDDKMARNMANDIRRQLGPNGLSLHKPVVTGPGVGPGGIPISAGRSKIHGGMGARQGSGSGLTSGSPVARPGSKDAGLESSMIQRLQKLEALNHSLRSEIKEKTEQVILLKDQN